MIIIYLINGKFFIMKPSQSYIKVLISAPLDQAYTYLSPKINNLQKGDFVIVPLGSRKVKGVVWDIQHNPSEYKAELKSIISKADIPGLSNELLELIEWISNYTLNPKGNVLRLSMPPPALFNEKRYITLYKVNYFDKEVISKKRKSVLRLLKDKNHLSMKEIIALSDVSRALVKSMVKSGIINEFKVLDEHKFPKPDINHSNNQLTLEQSVIAKSLIKKIYKKEFSVTVIDGVTSSGKTEVYFEAIAEVINLNRQCLVMLPEIALTSQWLQRFTDRFGVAPVVWHSGISVKERANSWKMIASAQVSVVVGARSSLFLPFKNLSLIVIDEEHDASYKQQEGVNYNARDMAIVRGRLEKVPVVLVSATPSLETIQNIEDKKYNNKILSSRFGKAKLPKISLIDLRKEPPSSRNWISTTLNDAIEKCVNNGRQALLFLNRRGYAPLTLCRKCGYRFQCKSCSAWLVFHSKEKKLICHHCGYKTNIPKNCPSCGEENSLSSVGPGVERIAEEVKLNFPNFKQTILSSDLMTEKNILFKKLNDILENKIDIIIGTQIISKGLHFPNLNLVGVIDADLGLSGGDLRASERTFQLLTQVSGRAGREKEEGRAFLQTYLPYHPVMQAIKEGSRDSFYKAELNARKQYGMPPFGRLVGIIVTSSNQIHLKKVSLSLSKNAPRNKEVLVLGPAPAPLNLLRGRYRERFLIKSSRSINIQPILKKWIKSVKVPKSVLVDVDIDPYTFF